MAAPNKRLHPKTSLSHFLDNRHGQQLHNPHLLDLGDRPLTQPYSLQAKQVDQLQTLLFLVLQRWSLLYFCQHHGHIFQLNQTHGELLAEYHYLYDHERHSAGPPHLFFGLLRSAELSIPFFDEERAEEVQSEGGE